MFEAHLKKIAAMGLCLAGVAAMIGCSERPDDQKIVQSIQAQYQKDDAISGEVTVESLLGTVTLNGHVANEAARKLAAREAAAAPGVKQVINNLTVTEPVEAAATPAPRAAREPRHARERREPAPRPSAKQPIVALNTVPPTDPTPAPAVAPTPAPVPAPVPAQSREPERFAPLTPSAPAAPPAPTKYTVPEGTTLTVRLIDTIDSSKNKPGDTFRATLNAPIRVDGDVAVPAGTEVEGRIVDASNAGRFTGHSELKLELTKLTVHGNVYELQTADFDRADKGRGKGTAETVGGGAALGAIIGAIAGGGKGAAIGTVAGGGAGGAARGVKGGKAVRFPSESVLSFKLQQSITVAAGNGKDPGDSRRPINN
jgi:outer membrane biosynthesis protein TonB